MRKCTLLILLVLVSCGMFARSTTELDSLRKVVLLPKIQNYQNKVEEFTKLINSTQDKSQIKNYARQIIEVSNIINEDIKILYDYRIITSVEPVFIGAKVQTLLYANLGGFIYPIIHTKVGSLPDVSEEIDYIKAYAWRIRLAFNPEMIKRNVLNINKRNSNLQKI